jgi:hypothetical protein
VTARDRARAIVAALGVAAIVLLVVELAAGARDFGAPVERDPCTARPERPGSGADATLQQIVLDGLDGAACELGTTREQLVLALDPELSGDVPWTREELEDAVRAGLLEAIDRARERGGIGPLEARILEEVVRRAPLDWLIEGGGALPGLLERFL